MAEVLVLGSSGPGSKGQGTSDPSFFLLLPVFLCSCVLGAWPLTEQLPQVGPQAEAHCSFGASARPQENESA